MQSTQEAMKLAAAALCPPEVTCAVVREGAVAATQSGLGVKPIRTLLATDPDLLKGAVVADTVIGKAAAMLLVRAGVVAVHGTVMSRSAADLLDQYQLPHRCDELVPMIINRTGDDMCPLEKSVLEIEDLDEAAAAIEATVARLMAQKK